MGDLHVDEGTLVVDELTTLPEDAMILALFKAWKRYYGALPEIGALSCCIAQMALETGRMEYCHRWNVGNIKKRHTDDHPWCMYRCSEVLKNAKTGKWEEHWFDPPHPQTHFRAYENVEEGMLDYLRLLVGRERYAKAWSAVLAGNPREFSRELKKAGYYTASEPRYTRAIVQIFNEFGPKCQAVLGSAAAQPLIAELREIEVNAIFDVHFDLATLPDGADISEDECRRSITANELC